MRARLKSNISKTQIVKLINDKYIYFNGDRTPALKDIIFKKSAASYRLRWRALNDYGTGDHYTAHFALYFKIALLHIQRIRSSAAWCESDCEPCTCKRKKHSERDEEDISITLEELAELGWLEYTKVGRIP